MCPTQPAIFFIRHGKLLLPYTDHSAMPFSLIADLAVGKCDPPIDRVATQALIETLARCIPLQAVRTIVTSSSRRCRETAEYLSSFLRTRHRQPVVLHVVPALREITFDLHRLYARPPFHPVITALNARVLRAMAEGVGGGETARNVYVRVQRVFRHIQPFTRRGSVVAVTHDFFMRMIEFFIHEHGERPARIRAADLLRTQRNGYCRGFGTDAAATHFCPVQ